MQVNPGAKFLAAHGSLAGQILIADDFEFTDEELDRLLITQARHEGLTVVTADGRFADYDVDVIAAA
jgi:PIN domain nuclease of toxin-antitoxin system